MSELMTDPSFCVLKALRDNLQKRGDRFNLSGKEDYIGLYFSAQWCPPCRAFTPQLKRYYEKVNAGEYGGSFEIVFISMDADEESFDEYFSDMPWAALDFSQHVFKERLSAAFDILGYPSLVILDRDGHLVTKNGRSCVIRNKDNAQLNWT